MTTILAHPSGAKSNGEPGFVENVDNGAIVDDTFISVAGEDEVGHEHITYICAAAEALC